VVSWAVCLLVFSLLVAFFICTLPYRPDVVLPLFRMHRCCVSIVPE